MRDSNVNVVGAIRVLLDNGAIAIAGYVPVYRRPDVIPS